MTWKLIPPDSGMSGLETLATQCSHDRVYDLNGSNTSQGWKVQICLFCLAEMLLEWQLKRERRRDE